ncbi:tetratricopeptide repeat protein [Streptomyces sp. NPDC002755]
MDPALHRAVLVQGRKAGAGHVVGPDLVLSACHVTGERGADCRIRPIGGGIGEEASVGHVVWSDVSSDCALIRVEGRPWDRLPDRGRATWARLTGLDAVRCVATGFPWAAQQIGPGTRDRNAQRQHETVLADIVPSTGFERGRYALNVVTVPPRDRRPSQDGTPQSPWAGMSGAGLLSAEGRHVVGVVVTDPHTYPGGRIEAARAEVLMADGEFRALVGAAAEDLLILPRHPFLAPARRGLPATRSEVDLLLAAHTVVDYIPPETGSDADPLERLIAWCEGPPVFGIAVLTGDGGSGKTRLATELCRGLTSRGWQAGHLSSAPPTTADREIDTATLMVVDDVEYADPAVGELLRRLAARPGGAPVRVLLLARYKKGSYWSVRLASASNGVLERHTDLEIDLNSALLEPSSRRQHMAAAATAFARALGVAAPVRLPDVTEPEFANPLLTHARALLAVCGEEVDHGGGSRVREQVMRTLLHRERERWERHRATLRLDDLADQRVQSTAVALVALTAPTENEVVGLLAALPLLDDLGPGLRRRTATWLRDLFPPLPDTEGRIRGPSLDLVVESLLAEQDPGVTADLLARLAAAPDTAGDRIAHALQVIRLAAENRDEVGKSLAVFLERHVLDLVQRALQPDEQRLAAALSMALAFTAAVEGVSPTLLEGCAEAAPLLPYQRPSTAELAATLYDICLGYFEQVNDRLTAGGETVLPVQPATWSEAGLRYQEAGRWREGLAALRRAADGYEHLMEQDAERYRGPFAVALQNLGTFMVRGRRQDLHEAAAGILERALTLFEQLVERDASTHSRGLAACLHNLSLSLLHLDRLDEAMAHRTRAMKMYERLAAEVPDENTDTLAGDADSVTIDYVNALIALGMLYQRRGLHLEAVHSCERAVALCERQGADNDSFALHLAGALTELGRHYADLGRPGEGIAPCRRAVGITRHLAGRFPEQFRHHLVDALTTLSRCHVNSGAPGEVFASIQEAMDIATGMVETHPWLALPTLSDMNGLLATAFGSLGRDVEALHCAERAVEASRKLVDADPVAYLPVLAEDLRRLADRCRAVGELGRAFAHARRSVEIRRRLAGTDPDRRLGDLPESLRSLAWVLHHAGMKELAAAFSEQAVLILHQLTDAGPRRFQGRLAAQLSDHGVHCAHLGLRDEAFRAAEEAVELYEPLAQREPDTYLDDLATCLNNLGNRHRQLGDASDALPYHERSVRIWEGLFARAPAQFRSGLVNTLVNLGECLAALDRAEEGLTCSQRALVLREEVCDGAGPLRELPLAVPLKVHHRMLARVGRLEESLQVATRVAEIYREEYRGDSGLSSEYPAALAWVATRHAALGHERQAREAHRSEVTIWADLSRRDGSFADHLADAFRRYADTMDRFGHPRAAGRLRHLAVHHDLIFAREEMPLIDLDDHFFIDHGWETVAVAVAAAHGGDEEAAAWVDAFLVRRAQTADWTPLACALQRVRRGEGVAGETDGGGEDGGSRGGLFVGLDAEDALILRRTLDLIRLPAAARPVFTRSRGDAAVVAAWHTNIRAFVLAAQGRREQVSGLESFLVELEEDPLWEGSAARIRRIIDGERGLHLRAGLDPFGGAVVSALLVRVNEAERSGGPAPRPADLLTAHRPT